MTNDNGVAADMTARIEDLIKSPTAWRFDSSEPLEFAAWTKRAARAEDRS